MPAAIDPSDIIGKRFGALTVKAFAGFELYTYGREKQRTRKDHIYQCDCACGKTDLKVRRIPLITGHKGSCGCQWKPTNSKSWRWTGLGEISGMFWSRIQRQARHRGIPFQLTIEEAWAQFLEQGRRCALTGVLLAFETSVQDAAEGNRTASLDRIDSSQPYIASNVQWVHKDVNLMKMDLPPERFLELCRMVVTHAQEQP